MSYVTFLDKKRLGGGPRAVAIYHALHNPGALIRDADGKIVDVDRARLSPEVAALLIPLTGGAPIDPTKLPGATVLYDARNPETKGPGRPKLGVVAREVTLLPRHWEWLNSQPGGASRPSMSGLMWVRITRLARISGRRWSSVLTSR